MRACLVSLLAAACSATAADRALTATSQSPHVAMRAVDMNAVRWTGGFWANRFALARDTMIPKLWQDIELPDNGGSIHTFRVAAGLEKKYDYVVGKRGPTWWNDGDVYKWLETVAHVYALTRDPALDRRMDEVIALVGKAQAEDGYISTPLQINGMPRWQNLNQHELYNQGHMLTAACIHYRATGKDSFLKIARKNADYLYKVFSPRPKELAHFCFNPAQIMGLVELYRTTREPRYLQLAGIFVDMRGSQPGGSDQNQTRVPLRKETLAVGHAVVGPYLWAGAADVYAETGEKPLFAALERIWKDATTSKMYVTGAVGQDNKGISPRGDPTHEAFGMAFELPNRIAYNETCANIANAIWNWRMLTATADARYADVMEQVFYNSMLSGMSLDGKSFFYANPLTRRGDSQPTLHNESLQRWSNTTAEGASRSWCCPPNLSRTLAGMHEYAYGLGDNTVFVNLYGSNALDTRLPGGAPVRLKQQTDYPWDGAVRITVETPGDYALMLRIPAWAAGATLRAGGTSYPADPGHYAAVPRKWNSGDMVELNLPMDARRVVSNPAVEAANNHVAVMRGPIVYCLESPDVPESVRFDEVALPDSARMEARREPKLLGGVTVLEGEAIARSEPAWRGGLYRTLVPAPPRRFRLRLIPYYAWSNRGISYMTVWIPRASAL